MYQMGLKSMLPFEIIFHPICVLTMIVPDTFKININKMIGDILKPRSNHDNIIKI